MRVVDMMTREVVTVPPGFIASAVSKEALAVTSEHCPQGATLLQSSGGALLYVDLE